MSKIIKKNGRFHLITMESLELFNYTVTDSQLNHFEAEIGGHYKNKDIFIKIRSPWNKTQIFPHSIEILSNNPFDFEQKEAFKQAVAIFLKNKLLE